LRDAVVVEVLARAFAVAFFATVATSAGAAARAAVPPPPAYDAVALLAVPAVVALMLVALAFAGEKATPPALRVGALAANGALAGFHAAPLARRALAAAGACEGAGLAARACGPGAGTTAALAAELCFIGAGVLGFYTAGAWFLRRQRGGGAAGRLTSWSFYMAGLAPFLAYSYSPARAHAWAALARAGHADAGLTAEPHFAYAVLGFCALCFCKAAVVARRVAKRGAPHGTAAAAAHHALTLVNPLGAADVVKFALFAAGVDVEGWAAQAPAPAPASGAPKPDALKHD